MNNTVTVTIERNRDWYNFVTEKKIVHEWIRILETTKKKQGQKFLKRTIALNMKSEYCCLALLDICQGFRPPEFTPLLTPFLCSTRPYTRALQRKTNNIFKFDPTIALMTVPEKKEKIIVSAGGLNDKLRLTFPEIAKVLRGEIIEKDANREKVDNLIDCHIITYSALSIGNFYA